MDPIENDGFPGFVVLSRSDHVLERLPVDDAPDRLEPTCNH